MILFFCSQTMHIRILFGLYPNIAVSIKLDTAYVDSYEHGILFSESIVVPWHAPLVIIFMTAANEKNAQKTKNADDFDTEIDQGQQKVTTNL